MRSKKTGAQKTGKNDPNMTSAKSGCAWLLVVDWETEKSHFLVLLIYVSRK